MAITQMPTKTFPRSCRGRCPLALSMRRLLTQCSTGCQLAKRCTPADERARQCVARGSAIYRRLSASRRRPKSKSMYRLAENSGLKRRGCASNSAGPAGLATTGTIHPNRSGCGGRPTTKFWSGHIDTRRSPTIGSSTSPLDSSICADGIAALIRCTVPLLCSAAILSIPCHHAPEPSYGALLWEVD